MDYVNLLFILVYFNSVHHIVVNTVHLLILSFNIVVWLRSYNCPLKLNDSKHWVSRLAEEQVGGSIFAM
jgi:hypothetical protein